MTLSNEQIQELLRVGNPTDEECRLIRMGWDAADEIERLAARLEAAEKCQGQRGNPCTQGSEMINTELMRNNILTFGLESVSEKAILEFLDYLEAAERGRDELQAKVEAMEQQGPVAHVWRCDNGHIHGSSERSLPTGTKLYALPVAKGEEK